MSELLSSKAKKKAYYQKWIKGDSPSAKKARAKMHSHKRVKAAPAASRVVKAVGSDNVIMIAFKNKKGRSVGACYCSCG